METVLIGRETEAQTPLTEDHHVQKIVGILYGNIVTKLAIYRTIFVHAKSPGKIMVQMALKTKLHKNTSIDF